jgi:p-hydroxybenzoate 3-monooxygenase
MSDPNELKTRVLIVGAGPAGLFLSHLLHIYGIENLVVEQQSRDYCEKRQRAGILEQGTFDVLNMTGVGTRLTSQAIPHEGIDIASGGTLHNINVADLTGGRKVYAYAQTEIVKDLFNHHETNGTLPLTGYEVIRVDESNGASVMVTVTDDQHDEKNIGCEFIAFCDGFRGAGRRHFEAAGVDSWSYEFPSSWLGILAEAPPMNEVVIYARHNDGFALQSMRSDTISRLYLEIGNGEQLNDWQDERIWDELDKRIGLPQNRGVITDKGKTPLRSYLSSQMRVGRCFLVGDSAHIVPPTGAKGLNLAIADAVCLGSCLNEFYNRGSERGLTDYSDLAGQRVGQTVRFSWWCTRLLHSQLGSDRFEKRMLKAEFEHFLQSPGLQRHFADNYSGLPFSRPLEI